MGLSEQRLYNAGMVTWVWMLTNRSEQMGKGKVQRVHACTCWAPMRKSLLDKRREISQAHIDQITEIHLGFLEGEQNKLFESTDFGCPKVQVERPPLLNFHASEKRIERLKENKAFQNHVISKKNPEVKAFERA